MVVVLTVETVPLIYHIDFVVGSHIENQETAMPPKAASHRRGQGRGQGRGGGRPRAENRASAESDNSPQALLHSLQGLSPQLCCAHFRQ